MDIFLWILRRRQHFRVVGHSMHPTLKDGDIVFVDLGAYKHKKPQVGELVLARHPFRTDVKSIKRVTAVLENERIYVKGDAVLESEDSRNFGAVPLALVYGRVHSLFL